MGGYDNNQMDDAYLNFQRGTKPGVEIEIFDSHMNRFGTEETIFERNYLIELNAEFNSKDIFIDIPAIGGMGGGETGQTIVPLVQFLMISIGPFLGGLFVNFTYDYLKSCILKILKKAKPEPGDHLIHIVHIEKLVVHLYNPERDVEAELDRSLKALLSNVKLAEDISDLEVREQEIRYKKGCG